MTDPGPAEDIVQQGGRPGRSPLNWLAPRRPAPRGPAPRWRPSRGAGLLAAATLVCGLAAGYAAGDLHARGGAAPPRSAAPSAAPSVSLQPGSSFSFSGSPALTQDEGACSAQTGQRELQLGVQVTNQSGAPLTLGSIRARVLIPGMLTPVAQQWAPCGTLPSGLLAAGSVLAAGASTWLSVTFQVRAACPGAAPVQFTVGYRAAGRSATADLPGFSDLGQVPYAGCPGTADVSDARPAAGGSGQLPSACPVRDVTAC